MGTVEHPLSRASRILAVVVVGLIIGAPFYWLIVSALKTQAEALAYPPTFYPHEIRWQNISDALNILSVRSFINTVIFTVSVTVLQLILVITTGFAIAKMPFPGRKALFRVFLLTMLVPFHVVLVPTFLVTRGLDMIDSYAGLILPIVAQTAFGVFVFRQFFITLPDELLEAARIDGANWGQIFTMIVLPLAGPPTAAYVAITVLNAWNMYVWPLVATSSSSMRVLPLSLASLGDELSLTPPNVGMMAVLISTLPVLVVFLFTQRWFVSGLGGALKE
jgi:ABC-type glycerol-3-phosphate transport system permease component